MLGTENNRPRQQVGRLGAPPTAGMGAGPRGVSGAPRTEAGLVLGTQFLSV